MIFGVADVLLVCERQVGHPFQDFPLVRAEGLAAVNPLHHGVRIHVERPGLSRSVVLFLVELLATGPDVRERVAEQVRPAEVQDLKAMLVPEHAEQCLGPVQGGLHVPHLVAQNLAPVPRSANPGASPQHMAVGIRHVVV